MKVPASTYTSSTLIPSFTGIEIVLLPEAVEDELEEYPELFDEAALDVDTEDT